MSRIFFFTIVLALLAHTASAQPVGCTFKPPLITLHFGSGDGVSDVNERSLADYERVASSCPSDGYYTFTGYTDNCFSGDWFTITEDHTPGDAGGNMMLVNASYSAGVFFNTTLAGLKGATTYEFAVWMMNVCRLSDKCPFPLLPNITIRLKTPMGRTVAQFNTGELPRRTAPHWTQYRAVFTMPAGETALFVTMQDNAPGGCGNDFALDDITIRECVPPTPIVKTQPSPVPVKKPVVATKPVVRKETPPPTLKASPRVSRIEKTVGTTPERSAPVPTARQTPVAAPPPILVARSNPLVKQIETKQGEININLYDNGEIDGDTVSVYHNNVLLISRARLSQNPVNFRITVDAQHPHHELIMVAHNLGSIPPNTSLMIVTAPGKRHEVFISSTEQKNAKVVFDLKE